MAHYYHYHCYNVEVRGSRDLAKVTEELKSQERIGEVDPSLLILRPGTAAARPARLVCQPGEGRPRERRAPLAEMEVAGVPPDRGVHSTEHREVLHAAQAFSLSMCLSICPW